MRCPYCLSKLPPLPYDGQRDLPLWLRILVRRVRCDACLRHFCRVRLLGWLIPVRAPAEEDSRT